MSASVSILSIILMALSLAISLALPALMFAFLKKRFAASTRSYFIGMAAMFVFAYILEQLAHAWILTSKAGTAILASPWLTALYGGLMAGLFEETGRFAAMKFRLRKDLGNNGNALMYGAGHASLELIYVLGLGMVNNLVYAYMINTGNTASLLAGLSAGQLAAAQSAIAQLTTVSPWLFVFGLLERLAAVIIHISLSVLVWDAVKKDRFGLYGAAILIHLAIDAAAVLLNNYLPTALVELVIWAAALAAAYLARRIWDKDLRDTPAAA